MWSTHVAHFGSNANNGTNAGRFYWNWNNDSSNANRNIGSHVTSLVLAFSVSYTLLTSWSNILPQRSSRVAERLGELRDFL